MDDDPPTKEMDHIRNRLAEANGRRDTLLHCHLAIGLWSAFEAAVNDFVVEIIYQHPERLDLERLKSMRLPAVEALQLGKRQLAQRVVDDYKASADGLGRADALLSLVGVHVEASPQARRRILELQQRRNAIAHRGSIVDERVVKKCPWLEDGLGQRISIEYRELRIYALHLVIYLSDALHAYGRALHGDAFGSDRGMSKWRRMVADLEDHANFDPRDWA
jgi:hypothetical protein